MGRLTKDPEIRYAQGSNTAVAKYSLAVDRRFKKDGEPEADFIDCTAFGKSAEFAEKYFKKGTKVLVTARMQNNNYTNKDGQKVYGFQFIVEEQEFAESKNNYSSATGEGFMSIPSGVEEELPFS